jgi:hypothetical protein
VQSHCQMRALLFASQRPRELAVSPEVNNKFSLKFRHCANLILFGGTNISVDFWRTPVGFDTGCRNVVAPEASRLSKALRLRARYV